MSGSSRRRYVSAGDEVFAAAFTECEKIPQTEPVLRSACFGGQGKEFIGLAMGRNFSGATAPSTSQLQMRDWCGLAQSEDGAQILQWFSYQFFVLGRRKLHGVQRSNIVPWKLRAYKMSVSVR